MDIHNMFKSSLDQSLRAERKRADDWKKDTGNIHVAHLWCDCGRPVREKLLKNLLIASPFLFEKFMFHFFAKLLSENQQKIAVIRETAKIRTEHTAVILLEDLSTMHPPVTVKDVIEGLEYAQLYRVIGQLQAQTMSVLSEHAVCHDRRACCKRVPTQGIPSLHRLQAQPSKQPGPSHKVDRSLRPVKTSRTIILLTFVEDGRIQAMKVKEGLEKSDENGRSYIVYTLSDFTQQILEDYVKNVLWILTLVDFVVPILTDGYMQMLEDDSTNCASIDERYAPYVAKLLISDWASSFKNKQLRCYKPKDTTWSTKGRIAYPPLLTFVNEPSLLPTILR